MRGLDSGSPSAKLRNLGNVIVDRPKVRMKLLEDTLRSGGTLSLPLVSYRVGRRQKCPQSATRTKRGNERSFRSLILLRIFGSVTGARTRTLRLERTLFQPKILGLVDSETPIPASLKPVQSSHCFAQVSLADMSIPGCHRNICVSTRFLDNLQIAGVHHQPGSKCVSEVMPTEVRYLGLG